MEINWISFHNSLIFFLSLSYFANIGRMWSVLSVYLDHLGFEI